MDTYKRDNLLKVVIKVVSTVGFILDAFVGILSEYSRNYMAGTNQHGMYCMYSYTVATQLAVQLRCSY